MCFELYNIDAGYPKGLFPFWRTQVLYCIANDDWNYVVLFFVLGYCSSHGDVDVQELTDQAETWDDWGVKHEIEHL